MSSGHVLKWHNILWSFGFLLRGMKPDYSSALSLKRKARNSDIHELLQLSTLSHHLAVTEEY